MNNDSIVFIGLDTHKSFIQVADKVIERLNSGHTPKEQYLRLLMNDYLRQENLKK